MTGEPFQKRFIVASDDYGIRETSEPILDLARRGKLDRVAVLANHVSEEQARALLATGVSLDIHLEIIELLGRGAETGDGNVKRLANFVRHLCAGRLAGKHIEREWRDQITRFRTLFGKLPDGFNSHEHIHYFPSLFRIYVGLARELGIGYVRFGRRGVPALARCPLVARILSTFIWLNRRTYARSGLSSSDYLVSFDWVMRDTAWTRRLAAGSVELVLHPERPEEYQAAFEDRLFGQG